jgi:phage shock protein A
MYQHTWQRQRITHYKTLLISLKAKRSAGKSACARSSFVGLAHWAGITRTFDNLTERAELAAMRAEAAAQGDNLQGLLADAQTSATQSPRDDLAAKVGITQKELASRQHEPRAAAEAKICSRALQG